MFPVPEEPDLSIDRIADYWSRFDAHATEPEYREWMIKAWWGGKLEGPEQTKRVEALTILHERGDNGWVVFLTPGAKGPPPVVEHADGSAEVDLRVRVPLPNADLDSWTEDNCAEAFEALAGGWNDDMCVDLAIGLGAMTISHPDFMDWIDESQSSRPKFWGHKPSFKKPSKPLTEKATVKFVEHYIGTVGPTATMARTEAAAREEAAKDGKTIRRDLVRTAYHDCMKNAGRTSRPGRRGNPPAE